MDKYTNLINLIKEMIQFFNNYCSFMTKKLHVVQENDTNTLEILLRDEQALILKLKGYDKKRENILGQLGKKGCSFNEIINEAQSEERTVLNNLYSELVEIIGEFKGLKDATNKFIELNMHSIELLLARLDDNGKHTTTQNYDKNGQANVDSIKTFKSTRA